MLYGEAKAHQMVRSILPSRACVKVERASIHKGVRRTTRMVTHGLKLVDFENDDSDWGFPDIKGRIHDMVRERRGADKLHPMMKWAEAVGKSIPDEDKMSTMKRLFPKNLIGRHALGHIENIDGFDPNPGRFQYQPKYKMDQPDWSRPWPSMVFRAVTALVESPGNVAALNAVVRRHMRRFIWKDAPTLDQVAAFRLENGTIDPSMDLHGPEDLPRWWKTVRGPKDKAVEHLVIEMAAVGFGDCWVEGVFVARCRKVDLIEEDSTLL